MEGLDLIWLWIAELIPLSAALFSFIYGLNKFFPRAKIQPSGDVIVPALIIKQIIFFTESDMSIKHIHWQHQITIFWITEVV